MAGPASSPSAQRAAREQQLRALDLKRVNTIVSWSGEKTRALTVDETWRQLLRKENPDEK